MLKSIDPLLGPDLLATLRAMGHGDDIVIADANFPAATTGRPLIRLDGVDAVRILDAVLSVMPLDTFTPDAAWRMEVVGDPTAEMPIFGEFRRVMAAREGESFRLASLERFAFYERARNAFAVVVSGERRLYGNIILKKGIVRPEA
ncbi:ribose ABC transporter [Alsobacter sp. SYSU M60028]|uniref:Ribose ABC transporter n=1 Tax=Alsobacter ponti TaxID=2962936 RepID=A0ABT1LB59_9HYPH|nr:RbsD/FucU domain-containing protein [Alsobacter ponti]MCP8938000.1 ribose ABC transporter [Alsobacter ponti]